MVASRSALSLVAAMVSLALLSCGEPEPDKMDYLRVVVDTNLTTNDLTSFDIALEMSGNAFFTKTYVFKDTVAQLPDSVVVENPHPSNASPEQQLFEVDPFVVRVSGKQGENVVVTRSAEVRFNRGQSRLVLPLCSSCLTKECTQRGETCKNGSCESRWVSSFDSDTGELTNTLAECGGPQAQDN